MCELLFPHWKDPGPHHDVKTGENIMTARFRDTGWEEVYQWTLDASKKSNSVRYCQKINKIYCVFYCRQQYKLQIYKYYYCNVCASATLSCMLLIFIVHSADS